MAKPTDQEMQTFLSNGTKYQIVPGKGKDAERALTGEYNPYAERKNAHPVTDNETLTHLLKAALGSGILTMPMAFSSTGLVTGIFMTLVTALICTHCAYVLVQCAQTLYHRHQITQMGFSQVAVVAFAKGPQWARKFSGVSKYIIEANLFVTYFGTGAVYMVIVVENIKQVVEHHVGEEYHIRVCLMLTLIPVILFSWVPNLKYLAPFSMMANFFMLAGLGITMFYLSTDLPPISERHLHNTIAGIPPAVAITIFAMEAIGVVMPLENQMENPPHFVGIFGVLNKGMAGVTIFYLALGFMGYWKYGDETLGSISLNLPTGDIAAQAVKILIGLAVFFTFGLQFYVCVDIGWNLIKDKFTKRPMLVNYTMRTVLATLCVLVAVAVPTISPFVGLIGAFCFSILGLLIPVLLQTVVYWDEGFGKWNWIIWKNVVVVIFGIMALIFGSKSSIEAILVLYK